MAPRSQLKFLIPGAALTWVFETPQALSHLLRGEGAGYARSFAGASLLSGVIVVSLFLYLILLPLLTGEPQPNYRHWKQERKLAVVIPFLTAFMVCGWSLLFFTLSYYTDLGALKGFAGAIGGYLTVFGLIGLIPSRAADKPRPL